MAEQNFKADLVQIVVRFIKRLPKSQRDVLWMKINGMKQEEIAETLDVSLSVVKTRSHRARKKLQAALEEKYLGEFTYLFR